MMHDLQKAYMWKRISAFLFDGIVLSIVAVLFAWLLTVLLGFDHHYTVLNDAYAAYGEEYGVDFQMSLSEYEALTEQQLQTLDAAYTALAQDEQAMYAYNMIIQLTLLITSLGIFLAFLVMEFFIPMLLKNGQTLGKKIFSLGVMHTEGIRLSNVALFVRAILGKYAVETMIPVLILIMIYFGSIGLTGTIVLGLIALTQLILIIATHTNSLIHDVLASTVVVDIASQMIFETREDLIAYKQKLHAEKVARESY